MLACTFTCVLNAYTHRHACTPTRAHLTTNACGFNYERVRIYDARVTTTCETRLSLKLHLICTVHPSLCYVSIPELSIIIDILNDMKKTLITQRKEKKLGPHPIVEAL